MQLSLILSAFMFLAAALAVAVPAPEAASSTPKTKAVPVKEHCYLTLCSKSITCLSSYKVKETVKCGTGGAVRLNCCQR
ncbi:hypothetical protein FPQ18DRAFT_392718 [Pyronema domesticum]|nr:hypothetical protein FPQ18DRAFT_392718 [Pyronema domesticum]